MCDTPAEPGNVEFQDQAPDDTKDAIPKAESSPDLGSNVEAQGEANRDRLGSTDSGKDLFRRQSSEPVGFRSRASSADSDADIFRRTQSAENFGNFVEDDETSIISDLAMDEMSEAAKSSGRRRSRLGGLLGSGRKVRQPRLSETQSPAQPEGNKGWFSRLGSNVSSQDETDDFLKSPPALKLKSIRLDPNVDFVCENPPTINVPLQKLDGRWHVLVTTCESPLPAFTRVNAGQSVAGESEASPQTGLGSEQRKDSEANLLSLHEKSTEQYFSIRFIRSGAAQNCSPSIDGKVVKTFSEIVAFHTIISECNVELIHHPLFYEKSLERTSSGDMSSGMKNMFGVSPLDSVRISGAVLAGLVDAISSNPPVEVPPVRYAEAAMDFLNSILECPLSRTAHFALIDFLELTDAPSLEVLSAADLSKEANDDIEVKQAVSDMTSDEAIESETEPTPGAADHKCEEAASAGKKSIEDLSRDVAVLPPQHPGRTLGEADGTVSAIASQCMAELLNAEHTGKLAMDILRVTPATPTTTTDTSSHKEYPLLPNHVTENLQNAMHVALMKVMTERDEAHAQLVSASVLHCACSGAGTKESGTLEAKLVLANKLAEQAAMGPGIRFGVDRKKLQEEEEERKKLLQKQMEMQQNSDSEIIALCEQLSGEISSRTQAALEVIRLKESRAIERKHETEEKEALRDELIRVKEQLAQEKKKAEEAQLEADRWKQYYERATSNGKNGEKPQD